MKKKGGRRNENEPTDTETAADEEQGTYTG